MYRLLIYYHRMKNSMLVIKGELLKEMLLSASIRLTVLGIKRKFENNNII